MNALTLKSLPDVLVERLRAAATMTHRSLNKEIIFRLERSFDRPANRSTGIDEWNKGRVAEQVAAWKEVAGSWESDVSLEEEIESLYAARSEGRKVDL